MALCESQLDSSLHQIKSETDSSPDTPEANDKKPPVMAHPNVASNLPLAVDYRSPRSHFVPPEVEMYAVQARKLPSSSQESGSNTSLSTIESNTSGVPAKRKRGRPRIDKTSPEYLAKSAARKQAKEMAAVMNSSTESVEKRKRGRPRIDKTSPDYLARKRARELEALERKAKRQSRRRNTGDSASSGDTTPRAKRKYTKRAPTSSNATAAASEDGPKKRGRKKKVVLGPDGQPVPPTPKVKGKRGRPRKTDLMAAALLTPGGTPQKQEGKIRVRSNLMPINNEPIPVDSEDEPDLGSPGQASDSLSLDENLRALRHLHEKYANIGKDDLYEAHMLAVNFKRPPHDRQSANANNSAAANDDDVLSIRSSPGRESVKGGGDRVEKLEDSSDSDSDSSSSGSGSSSSGSSSSSSSGSSSSSESSDSEDKRSRNGPLHEKAPVAGRDSPPVLTGDDRSFGAWSYNSVSRSPRSGSESDSADDGDGGVGGVGEGVGGAASSSTARWREDRAASLSESENESPDKSFQCTVCRKWYSTSVTLKIHKRSHVTRGAGNARSRARSKDRYECDCCSDVFTRRETLLEHKATAHRGAMTFRCEVCRRCFEDDAELAAHDRSHTADERAGRCSECGASFPRYDLLRRHRSCAHGAGASRSGARSPGHASASSSSSRGGGGGGGGAQTHTCRQCGKGFGHAHSLTRHLHNHAKQLYRCVVCKASFARADQLAQHLNSHLANYKRLKP